VGKKKSPLQNRPQWVRPQLVKSAEQDRKSIRATQKGKNDWARKKKRADILPQ
jgi:hypothetical protein